MKALRGFTLVELLVAIFILALVAAMAFKGLGSVISTRKQVDSADRKWGEISLFFSRMERELCCLAHRTPLNPAGFALPEFSGSSSGIDFTRTGARGAQRIGFRYDGGKIDEIVWPHPDPAPDAKPQTYVLLDHVARLDISFLAINNNWVPYWPIPQQARPKALKVSLTLDSGETIVRIFSLV